MTHATTTDEGEPVAFVPLVSAASLRADMYHLLAIGFLHPTRDLAAGLIEGGFREDVTETAKGLIEALHLDDAFAAALYAPADRLAGESFTGDPEAVYHELAVEYARLFIGSPTPAVSPYESVHVDSEPDSPALLMVGPSARAVLAAYREAGLSMAEGLNEPPDHIATEFEFMYYLCSQEAAAWSEGKDAEARQLRATQSTFAVDHLAAWGIEFARLVGQTSVSAFYASLASVTESFLRLEGGPER